MPRTRKRKYLLLFIIIVSTILISGCSTIIFGPSGSIEVKTTPSGAKIFLDSKDTGKITPYTLKNISAGNHIIEVTLSDIKYTEIAKVEAYKTTIVNIEFYSQIMLDKINVLPSYTTITLSLGSAITIISVTAYYSDYSSANIPLTNCTYSSNDACATINSSGTITGISTGAAIITVSYTEGGITKTDIVLVYIRNTPIDTPVVPTPVEPEPEPEPEEDAEVVYKISGTAPSVNITLSNSTGGTEQYSDVILPKVYSYSTFSDNFLYISAQNTGSSGTVNVECYYMGELKDSAHSEGAYVIATASYYISD